MTYVIVDTHTRCKIAHPRTRKDVWDTERGAKSACTRIRKIKESLGSFVVMDEISYRAQVPEIEVVNLMTGQLVKIPADTPWCCRPDAESFWSA